MASPVGHCIIGVGLGSAVSRRQPSVWWLVFAAFASIAPDLDFLPGLLVGDINRYHHAASHSLTAMVLFGVVSGMIGGLFRKNPWTVGLAGALFYGSHLVVDLFSQDLRPPYGIPLFWPFYDGYFIAPWTIIPGVAHGVPGDSVKVFLGFLFSRETLMGIGIEVMVLGPIAVLLAWLGHLWRVVRSNPRRRHTSAAP